MQGNLSALSSYIDHFKLFFWFGKKDFFLELVHSRQHWLTNKEL